MRPTKNKGFSLVQISILLMIASIIMVSVLPGGTKGSDAEKIKLTKERMQKIEDATRSFMAKNLRRPCPADGSIAPNAANFGIEAGVPGNCFGGSPEANFISSFDYDSAYTGDSVDQSKIITNVNPRTDNLLPGMVVVGVNIPADTIITSIDAPDQITISKSAQGANKGLSFYNAVAGVVPVRTLGLNDEYMEDGWGRRIMYFVNASATSANICRDMQVLGIKGGINIADNSTTAVPKDRVMWSLVSYGKDGHGAFPANGSDIASRFNAQSAGEDTLFNALVDVTFSPNFGNPNGYNMFYGQTLVSTPPTSAFDDIVWNLESTKNNCCIGKWCSQGFRMSSNSTGGTDNVTSATGTLPASANLAANVAWGDINGDGIKDMVVAQGNYIVNSSSGARGRAYVIFGKKTGWPTAGTTLALNTDLDGKNGFMISNNCSSATNYLGRSVAVGDIDGDGYDDIVLGGTITSGTSKLAVIYGKASGFSSAINLTDLNALTSGFLIPHNVVAGSTNFGAVALGDVNGDGVKDIITGLSLTSYYYGYVHFGRTKANWNTKASSTVTCSGTGESGTVPYWPVTSTTLNLPDGFRITSLLTGTCGLLYAGEGGLTKDSSDIDFTAFPASNYMPAYIYGKTVTAPLNAGLIPAGTTITDINWVTRKAKMSAAATATNTTVKLSFSGITPATYAGINNYINSLATGDVNNDGYDDIIIGGSLANTNNLGTFVMFGRASEATTYASLGTTRIPAATNPTWEYSSTSSTTHSSVCVYADSQTTFSTPSGYQKTVKFYKASGATGFGRAVATGDMNNDNIKDILIAADGKVYVYYGRASTGTNWQAATIDYSSAAAAPASMDLLFNFSTNLPSSITASTLPMTINVADMNNDGLNDLIVSSQATSFGGTTPAGSIFVLFQPSSGWGSIGAAGPPRTITVFGATSSGTIGTNFFGSSGKPLLVTSGTSSPYMGFRIDGGTTNYAFMNAAADFNNDGKTDILVTAPGGNTNRGYFYLLWGRNNVPWDTTHELITDIQ